MFQQKKLHIVNNIWGFTQKKNYSKTQIRSKQYIQAQKLQNN